MPEVATDQCSHVVAETALFSVLAGLSGSHFLALFMSLQIPAFYISSFNPAMPTDRAQCLVSSKSCMKSLTVNTFAKE